MSFRHVFDPVALEEYKDAVSWYIERSELATENFIKEVKEKIKDICKDPLKYRNPYKTFLETSLKKYPYTIVYMVDQKKKLVIITSIYHNKRDPRKKYFK